MSLKAGNGRDHKQIRHIPTDVSDEEWEFCAPYLTLMDPEVPQRRHRLRELFNSLRYIT